MVFSSCFKSAHQNVHVVAFVVNAIPFARQWIRSENKLMVGQNLISLNMLIFSWNHPNLVPNEILNDLYSTFCYLRFENNYSLVFFFFYGNSENFQSTSIKKSHALRRKRFVCFIVLNFANSGFGRTHYINLPFKTRIFTYIL